MKKLHIVTAVIELGAGLALLAVGVACWLAQYDAQSRAGRGLISAMVLYNFGAAAILGVVGLRLRPVGIALWPAVALHAAMPVWCVTRLLRKPTHETMKLCANHNPMPAPLRARAPRMRPVRPGA